MVVELQIDAFRILVTKTEDVNECRDANEEHNLGFDHIGCNPQYQGSQLDKPIPEDDNVRWEIQRFGFTEEGTLRLNPKSVCFLVLYCLISFYIFIPSLLFRLFTSDAKS